MKFLQFKSVHNGKSIHVDRTSVITDLTGFFFQLLHLATKHLNLPLITTWESGKWVDKIVAAFPPGKGFTHQINVNTVLVLFVSNLHSKTLGC